MPAGLIGLVMATLLAGPQPAPAQPALFAPGAKAPSSSQLSPRVKAGLEAAAVAALQAGNDRIMTVSADTPTDCKMLKPIDPDFRSRMRVATPDPKTRYVLRIVPVPSCEIRK